ncbi:RHS repeat-associated core domain-containing protein [Methylovulum psychrotolerans]|uniref:RHS repeat-associated core domain-containing protein n=1 Tax=Methylovulum psychrotolerans TaxID=1704499 RepID=UPI0032EF5E27
MGSGNTCALNATTPPSQCPANPQKNQEPPQTCPPPEESGAGPGSESDVGNPINPGTGDKYQVETDYQGTAKLRFMRYYHSSYSAATGSVGSQWQHNYDSRIYSDGSTIARVVRANGKQVVYTLANGVWASDTDINDKLTQQSGGWQLTTAADDVETYDTTGKLTSIQDRSGYSQVLNYPKIFDTSTPPKQIGSGPLQDVIDTYGHKLSFTYDSQGRVATLIDPAGGKYTYTYDTNNNLIGVSYPDNKGRIYLYNEQDYTSHTSLPNALTGIIDENNVTVDANGVPTAISNAVRYATFNYDTTTVSFAGTNTVLLVPRAISTEHAGGVEKYQISYGVDANGNPVPNANTITDPLGSAYTRNFSVIQGMVKSTGQNQPAGPNANCPAAANGIAYDIHGNVTQRTDFNGNTTCYAYDTSPNTLGKGRNLETVRIEGVAPGTACPADLTAYSPTANERKIATEWHTVWRVPTRIAEPKRTTLYQWADGSAVTCGTGATGVLCSKTLYKTADATGASGLNAALGSGRAWTYTYNSLGQLTAAGNPRTDVIDNFNYAYDANHQLSKITHKVYNAQNQLTGATLTSQYGNYDGHGRPQLVTDANGLQTVLAYDARGRLASAASGGRTTVFGYYPNGLASTVLTPANGKITYSYDDAHRLTGIANAAGESVAYSLDNLGNRTAESRNYPNGTAANTVNRQFDNLGRLAQLLNAANQPVATQTYDPQGNLDQSVAHPDSNSGHDQTTKYRTTSNTSGYDSLNRLLDILDANNGQTAYSYDQADHLTAAADPLNHSTTYSIDGLDNQSQESSPDRGVSKNTVFDNSGNVKTAVDAVGNSAAYTYDSLDRLLSANYTGATAGIANVGITYSYDTGPGALSRLSQTTDPSGSTQWQYDSQGRLTGKSQTVGAQTLSLGYTYDDAVTIDTNGDGAADSSSGRLASVTYPSQLTVSYTYDSAGRTKTLSIDTTNDGNANPQTVIDSITYYPWGGIKTYRLPAVAGQPTVVRYQNTDGRTTQYTQYNPADVANGNERKWLGYDRLGNVTQLGEIVRATSAVSVLQNYGYDKLNRLTGFTTADGTVSQSYSYDANGNRSNKTVGGVATTYTPDGLSNRLASVGAAAYSYDNSGNLSTVSNSTAAYRYDSRNRLAAYTATNGAVYNYATNALGQRVAKTSAALSTGGRLYAYDQAGHLIGEYDNNKARQQEHIWLGDLPVAMIGGGGGIYPVLSDHLGTPRQIIDGSKQVRWQWDNLDPFGANAPNTNPAGVGVLGYNLRFPGQYADGESGLFYNYYRTYDPKAGRYTQSDPIGLGGGMNTYGYVGGNPLNRIDLFGLDWIYDQSTGGVTHVDENGNSSSVGTGYAGNGAGRNNPAMQNVPDVGPIPQGTYDIGSGHSSRNTGPNTMNLTPRQGTNTFGRDLFRIHGDNSSHNASHGCIVLGPNIRNQINNSGDHTLQVVP